MIVFVIRVAPGVDQCLDVQVQQAVGIVAVAVFVPAVALTIVITQKLIDGAVFAQQVFHQPVGLVFIRVRIVVAGQQIVQRAAVPGDLIDQPAFGQQVIQNAVGFGAVGFVVPGQDLIHRAAIAQKIVQQPVVIGQRDHAILDLARGQKILDHAVVPQQDGSVRIRHQGFAK